MDEKLGAGPHHGPVDCPTWYDYCSCTVGTLVYNIERAERAEDFAALWKRKAKLLWEWNKHSLVQIVNERNELRLRLKTSQYALRQLVKYADPETNTNMIPLLSALALARTVLREDKDDD